MNSILTKYPVAETQDFSMSVEFFKDRIWLHSDVVKWTPRVKKDYIKMLNMVQGIKLLADLYAVAPPGRGRMKLEKFMRIIGFRPIGREDFNGLELTVYRRPLPWVHSSAQ